MESNLDGGFRYIFTESDDEFPFLFLTKSKKSGLGPTSAATHGDTALPLLGLCP